VVLGGEPDHLGAAHPQQLDRDRADPARGGGDDDGVALGDVDRASAWLARSKLQPSTSSPGAKPATSIPTSVTTPAMSLPCPEGKVEGNLSLSAPSRIAASPGLIPAALTSTTTSSLPGSRSSTSRT
jgi:hypothetical protein